MIQNPQIGFGSNASGEERSKMNTDNAALAAELRNASSWGDSPNCSERLTNLLFRAATALEARAQVPEQFEKWYPPTQDDKALRNKIATALMGDVYWKPSQDKIPNVAAAYHMADTVIAALSAPPSLPLDANVGDIDEAVIQSIREFLPPNSIVLARKIAARLRCSRLLASPPVERKSLIEAVRETLAKFDALPPTQVGGIPPLGLNKLRAALEAVLATQPPVIP